MRRVSRPVYLLRGAVRKKSERALGKRTPPPMSLADFIRVIFSVIIPPLGVFLQEGFGAQFWINVLLTLLGYVPGLVHAIWIIARR